MARASTGLSAHACMYRAHVSYGATTPLFGWSSSWKDGLPADKDAGDCSAIQQDPFCATGWPKHFPTTFQPSIDLMHTLSTTSIRDIMSRTRGAEDLAKFLRKNVLTENKNTPRRQSNKPSLLHSTDTSLPVIPWLLPNSPSKQTVH